MGGRLGLMDIWRVVMVLILRRWPAGWSVGAAAGVGSPGRSGGVNYCSHVRRRRRPPLQRSLIQGRIWRTRISGLDRLSMRSGHRFTVGESFRSRLWSGANGALPHALEHRRRWGLLALGDLPKREHPL
jgi:hypothetical protein